MLTKSDLIEIKKIIREEIGNEAQALKNELQADITIARMRIQTNIDELTNRAKNIEIRFTKIEEHLKKLDVKITKMHKELKEEIKTVSSFLDKENMETLKRVKRIEEHLGILTS